MRLRLRSCSLLSRFAANAIPSRHLNNDDASSLVELIIDELTRPEAPRSSTARSAHRNHFECVCNGTRTASDNNGFRGGHTLAKIRLQDAVACATWARACRSVGLLHQGQIGEKQKPVRALPHITVMETPSRNLLHAPGRTSTPHHLSATEIRRATAAAEKANLPRPPTPRSAPPPSHRARPCHVLAAKAATLVAAGGARGQKI
jgi:hypothetical protein